MRRTRLIGVLLAFAWVPGASAQPLFGVHWDGSLDLVRLDRDTLRPLPGPRVPVAGDPLGWSFSPDRSRVVLGTTSPGAWLRVIGLRGMRVLGDVRVARRGSGIATTWAGPRRVLSVVVTPGCCGAGDTTVAGVDVDRRRVTWRRTLGGSLQGGEPYRRGFVFVLGPRGESVGPSRIVHVDGDGDVRSADLPQIRSGTEPAGDFTRTWDPGLALDRAGGRAFVVQARAPVAEVDLSIFEVLSHSLGATASDVVEGPTRHALWLGRGMLAVTGSDARRRGPESPAGLTLIDTRRWVARRIDTQTTGAAFASGTVLASGYPARTGLTGYSVRGGRRFHVYRRKRIVGAQPFGTRALVASMDGAALIDARTGRQLHRLRRLPAAVLAGPAPIF
jgi:hypothetical protein